ncbi:tetratricopeptide repeat protein [Labrys okinawensis]|uniref:tetratricopeptide repeat protein n=1 Tax=Labrys okinawensis TaxID=346911 RepID=UPI0039BD3B03
MPDSQDWAALIVSGTRHLHDGRHDLALADFNQAIALAPNAAQAFYGRALTHQHRNVLDEAIADFDKALQIDPTHIDALFKRSAVHRLKGDFDKAAADFDHAIASLWEQRERTETAGPEASAEAAPESIQTAGIGQAA